MRKGGMKGNLAEAKDGGEFTEPMRVQREVTLALIALNVFVFLIEPRLGDGTRGWFDARYSLSVAGFKAGYWWQLLTFQFLHGNWLHLGTNLVLLHSMGPVLETSLGRRRYLLLYMGSGALGGLVQVGAALAWPGHFSHAVVGASAGLCGLLGALGYLYADDVVKGLLFFVIPFQVKAKVMLLLAGIISMVGTVLPFGRVAHFAHLGGLVGGLFVLQLMRVKALPPPDEADRNGAPPSP
ncbi:MAG: hypothetical protein RL153_2125 [Verrucomicrobiota bacterium]|jgi:membrane associated rhomboid family serine protease